MNCSFTSITGKKFGLLQDICLAEKKYFIYLCIFFFFFLFWIPNTRVSIQPTLNPQLHLIINFLFLVEVNWKSSTLDSEVAGVCEVSGCGAAQPVCWGWQWCRRSSVQTDRPASVPSLPPDISGDDDGAADWHHHFPPHQQWGVSNFTLHHIKSSSCFYFCDGNRQNCKIP